MKLDRIEHSSIGPVYLLSSVESMLSQNVIQLVLSFINSLAYQLPFNHYIGVGTGRGLQGP